MRKREASLLLAGLLITAITSCRSGPGSDQTVALPRAGVVEIESKAADPAMPPATVTSDAAPVQATPDYEGWQQFTDDRLGLSFQLPPVWVDMTGGLTLPAIASGLGLIVSLATDSERTGRSLLAGKPFDRGAFVTGLSLNSPVPAAAPGLVLVDIVAAAAPTAAYLTGVVPLPTASGMVGYQIDIAGGLPGLFGEQPAATLHSRFILFGPNSGQDKAPLWRMLVLSAPIDEWPRYEESFEQLIQSIWADPAYFGVAVPTANTVMQGELIGTRPRAAAILSRGVDDIWSFRVSDDRYVDIRLHPEDPELDLTATIYGSDRQVIAVIDNGYTSMTESAHALLLPNDGVYYIEISEFLGRGGRYSLSLDVADGPSRGQARPIAMNEVVQIRLPDGGEQDWIFAGTAGQLITIVLDPATRGLDAAIELLGPHSRRWLLLDEGGSGAPEVVAGFRLPESGEFAIRVRGLSPQGGMYSLSLEEGGREIETFWDAGDLGYGEVVRATWREREVHAWFFRAAAGDYVLVRLAPQDPALDPVVWLLDDSLTRVATADNFPDGQPETIEVMVGWSGQYVLLAHDYNGRVGEYELALGAAAAPAPEMAGSISDGLPVAGNIQPGDIVAWTFEAQAGNTVRIVVQPGELSSDLVLRLLNPAGETMREVDNGSAGQGETIDRFLISESGVWQIVVAEFFGEAAAYRLTLDLDR